WKCAVAGLPCSKRTTLARDREESLVAAHVAQHARVLLGALLAALGRRAGVRQLRLEGGTVERLRGDRLLDQQQRAVAGELQVALGLSEAHHVRLRAIPPQ